MLEDLRLGRRSTIVGGLAIGAVPAAAALAPAFHPARADLVHGVRTGDVTTDRAVIWARTDQPGRMMVRLRSGSHDHLIKGPAASPATDGTARIIATGLRPGREYDARIWFESPDGSRTHESPATFTTAPIHAAAQSVIWSGDVAGQGWGIDESRGGMRTFGTMLDLRPDVFAHLGDAIYADMPIEESVDLGGGQTWRNLVTPEVTKVAETLAEFRGRHRYNLHDHHVRAFNAAVPTVALWDDHETCNNWWPGEIIDEPGYTERRADILALRARRAWEEYQPIAVRRLVPGDGDGFVPTRIYRRIPRGQHLDMFALDMRSWRGPNPDADPAVARDRLQPGLLGHEQADWLIRELKASRATWKLLLCDQPLSTSSSHLDDLDGYGNGDEGKPVGRELELARILTACKRAGVRNIVAVSADVHFTAANHYDPARAAYADFDPFWEFISGPAHAEPFGVHPERIDQTFGCRMVYSKGAPGDSPADLAPNGTNQYFGHLAVAATGELTATLYDGAGNALWRRILDPTPERV